MTPRKHSESRDLFPGALEMMILQSVRRQPMHGYALVQHIKQRSNELLQVEEGSLYPALQRLLKEGLLKAEWQLSATNRRVRTYKITPAGTKHLEREVSRFEQMLEGIHLVLTPAES
jgi:PadR family transcriptional regulator PadR